MEVLKACTKCKALQPVQSFYKDRQKRDGLRSICIACTKQQHRTYYENNRIKVCEAVRLYREQNKASVAAAKKLWTQRNRHKLRAYHRTYAKTHPRIVRVRDKEKYKQYRARIRERRNQQSWWKAKLDPQEHLRRKLRSRLGKFITCNCVSAVGDCGLTLSVLLVYLNLTCLERYGVPYTGNETLFHVDHIRPLSSYDLLDPQQAKAAVHWRNLQILSVEDNLSKSDKY